MVQGKINPPLIEFLANSMEPYLRKGSIQEGMTTSIERQIDLLMSYFPWPAYKAIPAQLERLTINKNLPPFNNDKIEKIEFIKYPREEFVTKFNRCNVIGQPVLYGGFNMTTIYSEMKPDVGLTVTHSKWKLKEVKPLNWFPIFYITKLENKESHNSLSLEMKALHDEYSSEYSEYEKRGLDIAMNFFSRCFAKEVDENNPYDYALSAYISKKIFDRTDLIYDGILYPSFQMNLGFSNMAIRPSTFDERFKLTEVKHVYNSIPPKMNGINEAEICFNFDLDSGLILWD